VDPQDVVVRICREHLEFGHLLEKIKVDALLDSVGEYDLFHVKILPPPDDILPPVRGHDAEIFGTDQERGGRAEMVARAPRLAGWLNREC
jgi:hypothetical protein